MEATLNWMFYGSKQWWPKSFPDGLVLQKPCHQDRQTMVHGFKGVRICIAVHGRPRHLHSNKPKTVTAWRDFVNLVYTGMGVLATLRFAFIWHDLLFFATTLSAKHIRYQRSFVFLLLSCGPLLLFGWSGCRLIREKTGRVSCTAVRFVDCDGFVMGLKNCFDLMLLLFCYIFCGV